MRPFESGDNTVIARVALTEIRQHVESGAIR
jgi:hypothetical protein